MSIETRAESLLQRQSLYIDREDRQKLNSAVIAIAGIGGVGCPILDVLARNAISHFRISDIDCFDWTNTRQLYMTQLTIGECKVDVARERAQAINPDAEVDVFPKGVTPSNYRAFCEGATVICNQVDHIATTIMLHYAADQLRIPIVTGSRARWPERHALTVKLYDYRFPDYHYEIALPQVEERWGIPRVMIESLLDHIQREQECPDLMHDIAECNARFRQQRMMDIFMNGQSGKISDKPLEYLLQVAQENPTIYHKLAIAPEQAFMMGILAGAATKTVVLGGIPQSIEIDLYNWEAHGAEHSVAQALHAV